MRLFFLAALVLGCGNTTADDLIYDGAIDVPTDTSMMDSSKKDSSSDAQQEADVAMDAIDETADATDASDAGPDVPVSDGGVASIPGLVLWLDAAKGVTKNNQNQVSKWADQSGKNNDANQNNNTLQPVWTSNVINSLPVVHFSSSGSGSELDIADNMSLQWGTGDFLIEVVARFNNIPNNGLATGYGIFYGKVGMNSGIFLSANDVYKMVAGVGAGIDQNNLWSAQSAYNDNTPRSYGARRAGSTLEIRVQSVVATSVMQNGNVDVSASGTNAIIGQFMAQAHLNGDIAEMIAVKGSISMTDLSTLESYFKSKYNL